MFYVLSFKNKSGQKRYFNRLVCDRNDDWYDCDSLEYAQHFSSANDAENVQKELNAIVIKNNWYGKYTVESVA